MRGQRARWGSAALLLIAIGSAAWFYRVPPATPLPHVSGTIIPQIGHAEGIRSFVVAPDGKTVATLGGTVKFWDMQSGALCRTIRLSQTPLQPRNLRFSSDGNRLAFLDDTPRGTYLQCLDVASGHSSALRTPTGYCRDYAFLDKNQVCLDVNSQLCTYNWRTGILVQKRESASGFPWGAVSQGVALAGYGKQWALCNLQTGKNLELRRELNLQAAAFSGDGRTLVTGQNRFPAPPVVMRDQITFSVVNIDDEVPQIKRAVRPVAQATKAPDGTIGLWDVADGKLRRVITAFPTQIGAFRGVALSHDGNFVAAYGSETYKNGYRSCVKVWDSKTGQKKGEWPLAADGFLMTTLAVDENGKVAVAGLKTDKAGIAGAPFLWNSHSQKWQGGDCGSLSDNFQHLEWSPDGALLAGSSEIGAPLQGPGLFLGYYYSAYSISGAMPTFVFSGGSGFSATTIRLWDLKAAKMRPGFWGPIVPPRSAVGQGVSALQQGGLASVLGVCAFSPDGKLLAADEGGAIALRNMKTGALVRTLAAMPPALSNVGDWSQFLWAPQSQTLLAVTESHHAPPDENFLRDNSSPQATLTLWNTKNGKLQAVLATKARHIQAAYAADGRVIVALIDDVPYGWDAFSGTLIPVAALPAVPRGTQELCPRVLTRQGQIMRALRDKNASYIETRDLLTGKWARYDFPAPFNGKSYVPRQIFVAPDGSSLAVLQANGALALWNLRDWKLQGHIKIAAENPVVAPAPGGRFVAVAGHDGAIQIYDPAVSPAPLTLQVLPSHQPRHGGQEWAVFSADGYYNISPQAAPQLKRFYSGQMLSFPPSAS